MERFWSKVDKGGPVATNRPDLGRCWLWTAATGNRYGVFKLDGKLRMAHRVAWEWEHGPVPEGLELDHFACDRPLCVNPAHQQPTTPDANRARSSSVTVVNSRKTQCPKGHPYDAANTRLSRGSRHCRACDRGRAR